MLFPMKNFGRTLGLVLLLACTSAPRRPSVPLRWPHLPPRATFRGSILFRTQTSTHRGSFLLRYTPDSVAFLVKGLLGFSRSFRGRREEAPPELQALLGLVKPEFCGPAKICTTRGTLRVRGEGLPTELELPGRLRIRILRWASDSLDIPMEWIFESLEGGGRVRVTAYRVE